MLLPLHLPLPGLRAASTLNIQRPSSVRFIPPPSASAVVDATAWRAAAAAHRQRVLHLTGGALAAPSSSESSAAVERASQANKERAAGLTRASHPVYNFLFTYYSFDPGLLLRYSAGLGVTLPCVCFEGVLGFPILPLVWNLPLRPHHPGEHRQGSGDNIA